MPSLGQEGDAGATAESLPDPSLQFYHHLRLGPAEMKALQGRAAYSRSNTQLREQESELLSPNRSAVGQSKRQQRPQLFRAGTVLPVSVVPWGLGTTTAL